MVFPYPCTRWFGHSSLCFLPRSFDLTVKAEGLTFLPLPTGRNSLAPSARSFPWTARRQLVMSWRSIFKRSELILPTYHWMKFWRFGVSTCRSIGSTLPRFVATFVMYALSRLHH